MQEFSDHAESVVPKTWAKERDDSSRWQKFPWDREGTDLGAAGEDPFRTFAGLADDPFDLATCLACDLDRIVC